MELTDLPIWAQEQALKQMGQKPKTAKYRNEKVDTPVHKFDSKREAARYEELMLMLKAGKIRDLRLQPQFTLRESYITSAGERVRAVKYIADFSYERETAPDVFGDTHWVLVVEDAKGAQTSVYRVKRKLMKDLKGITIQEV